MPPHILVVEDEPKLAALLADYLRAAPYDVSVLHEGTDAVQWVRENPPDLLLLDLMLPGKDGLTICREVRAFSQIPIIMVTARVEEIDRLLGLELGADDYICKPFSPREVVARVKALLRRAGREPEARPQADKDATGLTLDADGYRALYQGVRLELTPVEFRLLRLLSGQPGRAFNREQLLNAAYDDERIVSDRTIDTHIKNLRRKLHQTGAPEECIASVYGVGYRFEGL